MILPNEAVPMDAKKFTDKHVKLSLLYVNPKVWPKLYDNKILAKEFKTLQYKTRQLLPIDKIDRSNDTKFDTTNTYGSPHRLTNEFGFQGDGRSNGRGQEAHETWRSMSDNGFQLCWIPISVCLLPDGKYYIMDGRTRLEYLTSKDFQNAIVDIYESSTPTPIGDWAVYANPPREKRSPQLKEDVIRQGKKKIVLGHMKHDRDEVTDWVNLVTRGGYTATVNGAIIDAIMADDKISQSRSWTEEQAENFLKKHGYNDNLDNNGIYYLIVSKESKASAILNAASYYKELINQNKKVKQLRIVINPGTLRGSNAEKSWKKTADDFRKSFSDNLNLLSNAFFDSKIPDNMIVVYAILPSVISLSQTWPFDKLCIFSAPPLNGKSFEKYGFNSGLTDILGIDEEEDELEEY